MKVIVRNWLFYLLLGSGVMLFAVACNPKMQPAAADDCIDPAKINADAACPMNYLPVCGCDGETYPNDCVARNAGVKRWTEGACGESNNESTACINPAKVKENAPCVKIYKPVCGCDGQTYNNDCLAENAGLTDWKTGKCPPTAQEGCVDPNRADSNRSCFEVYKPVCGCDGQTYSNACFAERLGILKWELGTCE